MSAVCPNGHTSDSTDYCDTCGAPIAAGGGASAASAPAPAAPASPAAGSTSSPSAGPTSSAKACPNCATENVGDALFCENCGYDFTTGAMPRPLAPPSSLDLGTPSAAPTPPAAPAPVAPAIPLEWVAEVWVDADWYALQEADAACPSPGLPVVVPLTERSVLVGRRSESRNIHPQVDLSSDVGVSRRHAQLTTDGQRWWVEDLQSANGTYVAEASAPLPTDPVAPGGKAELAEDDRIYLGAWTRIVVRRATAEEQAGTA